MTGLNLSAPEMNKIIIVEEDPVVWLDLSELLSDHFGAGKVERRSLPDVMAVLPEIAGNQSILILSDLPERMDPLLEAMDHGLRLVITNTVPSGESETLKGAHIVGRPFEPATLIEALTTSAPDLLPGGKALQEG
jgi:hypothetical protein